MQGSLWRLATALLAFVGYSVLANPSHAETTLHVDLKECVNTPLSIGQPVGVSKGNARTELSGLKFKLLDPGKGNNIWLGAANASITIKLSSVKGATEVDALMNTYYGQDEIKAVTVKFKGNSGNAESVSLRGNTTIRDHNNWVFTNAINGKSTQEWWTTDRNPDPQDQSKRLDVHRFLLDKSSEGKNLTEIVVRAPADAAANFSQPLVAALNVVYSGSNGTATCVRKD